MVIKVGINGFGRVGRVVFRTFFQHPDLQIAAINDPAIEVEYICYLIKFDSTHGKLNGVITHTDNEVKINDVVIKVLHHKAPNSIPWQIAGVQYVIEASGMFTSYEKASGHLVSYGVKRVIVTAPSIDVPIIILGVNENKLCSEHKVMSCGSSTLYCLAPIVKILEDNFGVQDGFITSIHAMTPSLKPLDGLCLRGKHWRDHRSIHQNIIPATTGACKALGKIIPQVKDKLTGLAFRVPIVNVSVLDLTIRLKKETTVEEIAQKVERASKSSMQNIIKISDEETVSSDFVGDKCSCILDVNSSLQIKPEFFKLVCWYENEYSYACRVVDSIFFSEKQLDQLEVKSKKTYVRPRLFKKQDMVQQTDLCLKVTSEIKYEPPNIPGSFSLIDNKKATPNILCVRKTFAPINTRSVKPSHTVNTNKKSDFYKILNDDKQTFNPCIRQNRNSFFQTTRYQNTGQTDAELGMKAEERLEKVKKEFSKMVDITENLLRKSCNIKQKEIDKGSVIDIAANCKEVIKKLNNTTLESSKNEQINSTMSIQDVKPSVSTINSKMYNDCSKEDVDSETSYYERNSSDYGVNEIKKQFMTKIDYLSLSCSRVIPKITEKVPKKNNEVSPSKPFVPDAIYSLTSYIHTPKLDVSKTDKYEAEKISRGSMQTVFNDKNQDVVLEPSNINNFKEYVIKTKKQDLTLEPFKINNFKEHVTKTAKQDTILMPTNIKKVKEHLSKSMKKETTNFNNLKQATKSFNYFVDELSKKFMFLTFSQEKNDSETFNEPKLTESKAEKGEKSDFVQILPSSVEKTTHEDISHDVEELSEAQTSSAFRPQSSIKEIICAEKITHDEKESILNFCQCKEVVKLNSYTSNYVDGTIHSEELNLQTLELIEVENEISDDFTKITDDETCNKENINTITNKINVIDEKLRKRNIVIIKDELEKTDKLNRMCVMDDSKTETHECKQLVETEKLNSNRLQKFVFNALTNDFGSRKTSNYCDVDLRKQDIYDKLDSASVTDSDSSFRMERKKSQIINITDLTTSLDDLERLDKICRIIEISDELSDKLFSALDHCDDVVTDAKKKWSFKDLCEKIKLDDFCNKVFT